MPSTLAMAAYPLSDIRPASVMQIRSTISVVPRCAPVGSISISCFVYTLSRQNLTAPGENDRAEVRADATISLEWFVSAGQTQPSTAPHIDGQTTTF
jgi:hypothetical protein